MHIKLFVYILNGLLYNLINVVLKPSFQEINTYKSLRFTKFTVSAKFSKSGFEVQNKTTCNYCYCTQFVKISLVVEAGHPPPP